MPDKAQAGLAIVLSDLFDANGYERGLDALAYGNFDVLLIQLVLMKRRSIRNSGARLHDIESTQQRRLTVNRRMLALYRQKIAAYFEKRVKHSVPSAILSICVPAP